MSDHGAATTGDRGRRFVHDVLASRIVFGAGRATSDLDDELDRLAANRVMVVASGRDQPLLDRMAATIEPRIALRHLEVRPHVPIELARRAREAAARDEVDAVLAIGGGSAIGLAKAVALTTHVPILAVPTTYAGSEVTPVWGLTEDGRKTTGRDPVVLPRTVIYDPELTLTLPPALSAVSGLNAMAHAVEAFWAPGRTPLTAAFAETSIRSLARGLPGVVDDGEDVLARGEVLLGAWLAGTAFAVAGSGLHHKICHVLGGAFDLPHAQTHAIVLPHVLACNAPGTPDAARRIGSALEADDPVRGLVALSERLGVPVGLRSVGLERDRIDEVVDDIVEAAPADNPTAIDADTVRALLHAAWAGPPTTGVES